MGGLYTTELTLLGRTFTVDEPSGASRAFTMAFGIGALFGPIVAGAAMQIWNPHGMLVAIGGAGAGVVLAAVRFANAKQPSPDQHCL